MKNLSAILRPIPADAEFQELHQAIAAGAHCAEKNRKEGAQAALRTVSREFMLMRYALFSLEIELEGIKGTKKTRKRISSILERYCPYECGCASDE